MFHWGVQFGEGDSDRGVMLMAGIPFLFSIYIGMAGLLRSKPRKLGLAIHSNTIWISAGSLTEEWSSKGPWWDKSFSWAFPWDLRWHKTEILRHTGLGEFESIYTETRSLGLGRDMFEIMRDMEKVQATVSETYDYTYTRKNGEVQHRKAVTYVSRMTWRARWWPLIPIQKSRTSINFTFDDEVGEKTGSWKGGCIATSQDMLPGETPLATFRRMERERKF